MPGVPNQVSVLWVWSRPLWDHEGHAGQAVHPSRRDGQCRLHHRHRDGNRRSLLLLLQTQV